MLSKHKVSFKIIFVENVPLVVSIQDYLLHSI